jgi:hypothetical protein
MGCACNGRQTGRQAGRQRPVSPPPSYQPPLRSFLTTEPSVVWALLRQPPGLLLATLFQLGSAPDC